MSEVEDEVPLAGLHVLENIYNNSHSGFSYKDPIEQIFAVCEIIGDAIGIKMEKPKGEIKPDCKVSQFLEMVAETNQLRMRKIRLQSNWHNFDHGQLIVIYNNRPCPLLWQSKGFYLLDDLSSGKKMKLNAHLISQLKSHAYLFYPSLPAKSLSVFSILKFTFNNLKTEMMKIVIFQIITSVIMLLVPIITGIIFDKIVPYSSMSMLGQYTAILLIISLIVQGIGLLELSTLIRIQICARNKIQVATWDRLLKLPLSFFKQFTVGDLTYRIGIINSIQEKLSTHTLLTIIGGSLSFINLGLMLYINVVLALAAVILVFVFSVVSFAFNFIILRYQREVINHGTELNGTLLSLLNGIIKIRVSHREEQAFDAWNKNFSEKIRAQNHSFKFENGLDVFNVGFIGISTLVIYSLVIWLGDSLSFGDFIIFNAAFMQFFSAITSLTNLVSESIEILPLLKKAQPIFTYPPEEETNKANIELKGHIVMQNLVFRYPESEKPILVDFNLEIKPGSFTAIVGPSGSGKSTLFRLMLGLEHFESGDIKYDGISIKNLQLQNFRSQIGVVMQTTRLIPGTIFENIAGKNYHLTREQAHKIAEMVGLKETIQDLPMGIDTLLNDGIQTLSGGEAQRLNLARAISSNPKILFLDEATSALDNKVQHQVQRYLQKMQLTRVVIAHRFSTIVHADQIHVVNGGRCLESGTFEELMALKGVFYELASQQKE